MGDGTAASAIKYLDYLIEKGRASNGAINPLKIAFTKVMQTIDGKDTWGETPVRNIDVDDYMHRFANLTLGKYSAESLTVYKSRVKKVAEWYTKFLDTPGWTPEIQRRNRATGRPAGASPAPSAAVSSPGVSVEPKAAAFEPSLASQATATETVHASPSMSATIPTNPERVVYPFPLSDGQLVHISLPFTVSKSDAKRIGAFVESIARDDA